MVKKLLILFIFLSFITKSIGGYENVNPILSRLTFSDIFGVLALIFGAKYILIGLIESDNFSSIYKKALWLVACMLLVIPFSLNIQSTTIEALIIFFLILISIQIFYLFREELSKTIFPVIINTVIAAATLGFYDLVASMFGLPRIFNARADGEVISGFRNAGQAGAYFLVFLTILIPLKYSNLKNNLSPKYRRRLTISIIISIVFIISTGKIAAYIGFVIGLLLFLLQQRNFKSVLLITMLSAFVFIGFSNLKTIAPALSNRLNHKIETRILQNYEGTNENVFFKNNFGGAINAFLNNPLTGTGIGGYYGNFGRYEVHSTYLKMLGEGGILITIPYLVFIIVFINLFRYKKDEDNIYKHYLTLMLPFIIGCLVSWGYTYHLRKREFWILIAVVMIVKYNAEFNKSANNVKLN